MMETATAPMRHDTKSPLGCCPRCYKAELAGRARKRPVFRYDKLEAAEQPSTYQVFHGEHHVATLSREGTPGRTSYGVRAEWEYDGDELRAKTLRDARVLVEEAYIATWRDGGYLARGPVRDL